MSTDYTYDEQASLSGELSVLCYADPLLGSIFPILHPHHLRSRHVPFNLLSSETYQRSVLHCAKVSDILLTFTRA